MSRNSFRKEYVFYLGLFARILDIAVVGIAGILAYIIRFNMLPPMNDIAIKAIIIQMLLVTIKFSQHQVYKSWRGKNILSQLYGILKAWGFAVLILALIGYLTKTAEELSRIWFIYWVIISSLLFVASKLLIHNILIYIRKNGSNEKKILYVGRAFSIKGINLRIERNQYSGFRGCAWMSLDEQPQEHIINLPQIHGLENLAAAIDEYQPDEIWVIADLADYAMCTKVNAELKNHTINIRFTPDLKGTGLSSQPSVPILGMLTWDVSVSPYSESARLIKLIEDKILSFTILIIISPIMLAIAIGIKITSPGPILFKQKRHGWDGKVIKVYKFRSMKVHKEASGKVTQASRNDSRITKFGLFLRKTSLDELPQFFNVLQGRMSIVGPRPHALAHNEEFSEQIDEYMRRHKVKPGITGWAQVNGWRGETDTFEKMKNRYDCDMYYIRNWSLWLDLKIIMLTILRVLVDKNAY